MIASYPCYYLGVTKGMFQFHAWNNWAANHFWFAWSLLQKVPRVGSFEIVKEAVDEKLGKSEIS